jgi:hypothetical protein
MEAAVTDKNFILAGKLQEQMGALSSGGGDGDGDGDGDGGKKTKKKSKKKKQKTGA